MDSLFYLHHGNLDRIFTEWWYKNLAARLNEVGGPVIPFDYGGVNVTLEFEINIGKNAGNITLHQALNTHGDVSVISTGP
jgi:tyrosinase